MAHHDFSLILFIRTHSLIQRKEKTRKSEDVFDSFIFGCVQRNFISSISIMESETIRYIRTPRITKKLLCFVCRIFFATVIDEVKDKDIYMLNSDDVENWQLKAFEFQTRFLENISYPIFCSSCSTEIGFCQNGQLYINRFKIKHVEHPGCKNAY